MKIKGGISSMGSVTCLLVDFTYCGKFSHCFFGSIFLEICNLCTAYSFYRCGEKQCILILLLKLSSCTYISVYYF